VELNKPNQIMKTITKLALAAVAVAGMAVNSHALLITAGTTPALASGPETSQAQINTIIAPLIGSAVQLYKDEGGTDSGSYASSYQTTYGSPGLLDEDFTITYVGAPAISANPVYLLVKDGNHNPAWYLYDITGWNGTDVIQGENFWPQRGGISHVTIYGTPGTPPPPSVPDGGATLLLLGSAVAGLGLIRRKLS
jgi:hypothetical protein